MQKASVLVLLATIALATGFHYTDDYLRTLRDNIDHINGMDWKTIDVLIDNRKKILAVGKVVIGEHEVNKDYAFKLIGHLSVVDRNNLYEIFFNNRGSAVGVVQDLGKTFEKASEIVKEALAHTLRIKSVDWTLYFEKFVEKCMTAEAAKDLAKSKLSIPSEQFIQQLYEFGQKMTPIQEQTLKTIQGLVHLSGMK